MLDYTNFTEFQWKRILFEARHWFRVKTPVTLVLMILSTWEIGNEIKTNTSSFSAALDLFLNIKLKQKSHFFKKNTNKTKTNWDSLKEAGHINVVILTDIWAACNKVKIYFDKKKWIYLKISKSEPQQHTVKGR